MRILAVDDQERVLKAIHKLVHWEELGVTAVYTASSAEEARKILENEQIDIMLTDIEMPGESGISLQKWQMEQHPEVTSIFLTSHADFAYAKEAIRNGAFDYILQPARIPEIEDTVRRCIEYRQKQNLLIERSNRLEEKQLEAVKSLVFTLFHQRSHFSRMDELKKEIGKTSETCYYQPAVSQSETNGNEETEALAEELLTEIFPKDGRVQFIVFEIGLQHLGFLFFAEEKIPDLSENLQRFLDQFIEKTGLMSRIHLGKQGAEDLPDRVNELMLFFEGKILKSGSVYAIEDSKTVDVREPDGAVWGRWLIRGDTSIVRNQIMNLIRYAQEEQYFSLEYIDLILRAFFEACHIACYEINRSTEELLDPPVRYREICDSCKTGDDVIRVVDVCLNRYRNMLPDSEQENYTIHDRVQEILRYLEENMDRMISRREAAKYVFLNEDYFSRIFQKETGKRYKEYVLEHKMEYAKKLLAATDLPVTLIASKVGFDNFTNFTKTFRRICDMTPTDFRKMAKSEKG